MAISNAPWNFTPHDYSGTADYCDACLINLNDGPREQWTQANCKLPIKEPSGDINVNGVHAAAAALSGARGGIKSVSADVKRAAAKALVKAYSQIHGDPPAGIARMAGM